MLVMLLASACAGPKGQSKAAGASDGSGVELKKAPPEAVKLAAAQGLPDPNELICTFDKDTGTNIPEKTCHTRWQLEEERRQAQDFMEVRARSAKGKGDH